MKTIITLPDLHTPYNIDLTAVEELIDWIKPDYLLYLGDAINFDSVSHWIEEIPGEMEGLRVKDDYDYINDLISRQRNIVTKQCKTVYFIGNHEDWIDRFVKRHPQLSGLIELKTWIKDIDIWIDFNKVWSIGHLTYLHGMWTNKYHAAKHLDSYMCNLIYGHTHDTQEFTKVTPQDQHPVTAKSIGCLCKFDMPYLKKRPTNWVNAFNVAYIMDDGTFTDYTIKIIDGHFVFEGEEF